LLTQAQLAALHSPTEQNTELLRDWLKRPTYGNNFLRGVEARAWDIEQQADMVALQGEATDQDPLARWLFRIIPGSFHKRWGYRWKTPVKSNNPGGDLFEYKDTTLMKFAVSISTFLSTLFPILSIFVLYYVRNNPARLGLIVAFTSLFAVALLLASSARKVEIFAATSAYVVGFPCLLGRS
jgi:hypothetical protein